MEAGDAVPAAWEKDVCEVLLGSRDISARVDALGKQITADFLGKNPLLVVVLKGSFVFAADLSRAIDTEHEVEFIRAKSYEGVNSTGTVKVSGLENVDLAGRDVIVVEDIVDTGLTLLRLVECLGDMGAKSVGVCSLLQKKTDRRREDTPDVKYVAFHIEDRFVVGYGLDLDQRFRHLPFVGVFRE